MNSPQPSTARTSRRKSRGTRNKERHDLCETIVSSPGPGQGTPRDLRSFVPVRLFFDQFENESQANVSGYYSESDTTERILESTRMLYEAKSYNPYIAYSSDEEFEEWRSQAKTDYTYSKSKSYRDSVTPDRRVGSPNMSRRALRSGSVRSDTTETVTPSSSAVSPSRYFTLRSRTLLKTNYSSDSEEEEPQTPLRSVSLTTENVSSSTRVTRSQQVSTVLPYGMDTPKQEKRFASPIVRQTEEHGVSMQSSANGYYADLNNFNLSNGRHLHTSQTQPEPSLVRRWWWSVVTTVITIVTTVTTFLQNSAENVSRRISSSIQSVLRPFVKSREPERYRVNTTTVTTAMWIRERISSAVGGGVAYYNDRRRNRPCLWLWLPLLLLLLPLAAYWWQSSPENKALVAILPTRVKDACYFLATLVRNAYDNVSSSLSTFTYSKEGFFTSCVASAGSMISGASWALWTFLCGVLLYLWTALVFAVSYLWALLQAVWLGLSLGARSTKESVASFVSSSQVISAPPEIGEVFASTSASDLGVINSQILEYIVSSEEFRLYLDQRLSTQTTKLFQNAELERNGFKADIERLKLEASKSLRSEDFERIKTTLLLHESKQQQLLSQFQKLSESLDLLKDELKLKKTEGESDEFLKLEARLSQVQADMDKLTSKLQMEQTTMMKEITKCCQKSPLTIADLEQHMTAFFASVLGVSSSDGHPASMESLRESLNHYFVNKQEFQEQFQAMSGQIQKGISNEQTLSLQQIQTSMDAEVLKKFEALSEQLLTKMNVAGSTQTNIISSSSVNISEVEQIVNRLLNKYDADKTGMADHALESAGGSVLSTRCTESYEKHYADVYVLGYSVYRYPTNNPRSIIQPSRNPGECWAFKGSQGDALIQLAAPVRLTGFTMEHIPKSLSPKESIDSAPRNFSVHGLFNQHDEGFLLGEYQYLDNNNPVQYFPVKNPSTEYFPYVELKVHSNHGNVRYTCVYRFRVHGVRGH